MEEAVSAAAVARRAVQRLQAPAAAMAMAAVAEVCSGGGGGGSGGGGGGGGGGVWMCKSYYQIEPLGMAGRVSETSKH